MNISNVATNSVVSVWHVPLEQTPGYLDPQSQEALYEVDVSGMALHFSFGQRPEVEALAGRTAPDGRKRAETLIISGSSVH